MSFLAGSGGTAGGAGATGASGAAGSAGGAAATTSATTGTLGSIMQNPMVQMLMKNAMSQPKMRPGGNDKLSDAMSQDGSAYTTLDLIAKNRQS